MQKRNSVFSKAHKYMFKVKKKKSGMSWKSAGLTCYARLETCLSFIQGVELSMYLHAS